MQYRDIITAPILVPFEAGAQIILFTIKLLLKLNAMLQKFPILES